VETVSQEVQKIKDKQAFERRASPQRQTEDIQWTSGASRFQDFFLLEAVISAGHASTYLALPCL
jgi:hypothetical protein